MKIGSYTRSGSYRHSALVELPEGDKQTNNGYWQESLIRT